MLTDRQHRNFWRKVRVAPEGCWEWTAGTARGYGVFRAGTLRTAHRLAYEMYHGPILDGMCVCHTCDNRLCVRKDHLFLGTHKENTADMVRKGRQIPSYGGTQFSNALVLRVWGLRERCYSYRMIATLLGLSYSQVGRILRGEQRKSVAPPDSTL